MRTGAIICFVIGGLALFVAINNMVGGANRPEGIENLVGYAAGSLLLPIVFLIGGLVMWGKAKKK